MQPVTAQATAVAKSRPVFNTIAIILSGATDRQNVACADLVFPNEDFIHAGTRQATQKRL